ncbi:MAG: hypothetical protein JWL73_364 [Actinomycetia bacterium]|nr:hypothetical protein [Actinomycetes bacterium]
MTTELRSNCDLAQPFCDDVVLVAGFFTPNAPSGGLAGSSVGLHERRLLVARGAYLAERVLISVTPLDVVAVAFGPGAMAHLQRVSWSRAQLVAVLVPSHVDASRPRDVALGLSRDSRFPRIEVAWESGDAASVAVVDRLVRSVSPRSGA